MQCTWVWANSRRWWRTGKPGVLQSVGLQSWTRVSNCWTTTIPILPKNKSSSQRLNLSIKDNNQMMWLEFKSWSLRSWLRLKRQKVVNWIYKEGRVWELTHFYSNINGTTMYIVWCFERDLWILVCVQFVAHLNAKYDFILALAKLTYVYLLVITPIFSFSHSTCLICSSLII